jgi:hypothetical protein
VSVIEPQPNPETVEVLLDTAWRLAASETARTDALDHKASTVATFASLVATLAWWALALFVAALGAVVLSVVFGVVALFPREHFSLGIAYLERFPTWSEIRKEAAEVRGETLRTLVEAVSREREANHHKARWVRWSFVLLLAGLVLIATEGATLATRMVSG